MIEPYIDDLGYGNFVADRIREGLWPFKVENVMLEMTYDVDFNKHWLYADVLMPSRYRLHHRERIDIERMDSYPEREVERIGLNMLDAFRFRETEPIPHNIYLGDEHS